MLKHAKASHFEAHISKTPNITITFKDNGDGFSTKKLNLEASNGLENMKSRASLIGFTFQLKSKINTGTTITLMKS